MLHDVRETLVELYVKKYTISKLNLMCKYANILLYCQKLSIQKIIKDLFLALYFEMHNKVRKNTWKVFKYVFAFCFYTQLLM